MHYLTELDLDAVETLVLLEDARRLKAERTRGVLRSDLSGKHVGLYFEKPSVRTRVSFTLAVRELGGDVVELGGQTTKVGKGEHVEDFARVMSGYVHALVARVFLQGDLHAMASRSSIPVINALSDERHPCQALADALTILERKGRLSGVKVAFIGEGNNVAASLGLLAAALGAEVRVASPPGFGLPDAILAAAAPFAGAIVPLVDPMEAARRADVLYTDTWVSMGREEDAGRLKAAFAGYKIDRALLGAAASDAIVMHCLPAVRGEEIDEGIMYGPESAIWEQAENRLHVQKALLRRLMLPREAA
jgi:ornithine carbamoyltransferase